MNFSIEEIIDIAIGMEDAGYNLYTRSAEKFEDQMIKDLFSFLAKQELEHKKIFKSFIESENTGSGEFNEEYYLYLKAIGGGRIYPEGDDNIDEVISKIKTPMDAINKGFQDEKNSILFYTEIKKLYDPESEIDNILNRIIEEERKHALLLYELKDKLLHMK